MRPEKSNNAVIEKALRLLEENGYTVKKQILYTKKTFEVSVETLKEIREFQNTLGYKLKDVVEEAFTLWLESKHTEYEKISKSKKK